ncbi:hypothetical protein CS022_06780 [Veronia nyctiphanis]|uniref:Uncharacterized protein n=1 Tax=Veronia nyctiphanis TaxID=1278244 RepID=A0A4Q0YS17_9GAMM|nr:hypothetical protein [Veronia nyctiphanis]RXJ73972.1 hypothetical protein CS022_06780 [Veronia nyctiphanis]
MYKLSAATLMFAAGNVLAATSLWDTGDAGLETTYLQGPIEKVVTSTRDSQILGAAIFFKESAPDTKCHSPEMLNQNTWNPIPDATFQEERIFNDEDIHLQVTLPDGLSTQPKMLRLNCDNQGESFVVYHKYPAAPVIRWESKLDTSNVVKDDWNAEVFGYQGSIFIDNHSPDGGCYHTSWGGTSPPDLLPGKGNLQRFSAEHFMVSGEIAGYDGLTSQIICISPGGIAVATELWDVRNWESEAPKRQLNVDIN